MRSACEEASCKKIPSSPDFVFKVVFVSKQNQKRWFRACKTAGTIISFCEPATEKKAVAAIAWNYNTPWRNVYQQNPKTENMYI